MALRDSAIVGFAETKIVTKSEVDIWTLGAQILEQFEQFLALGLAGFGVHNLNQESWNLQ